MLTGLIFAPIVALGSTLGGDHMDKLRLRQLAFTILFIAAGISVAAPMFSSLPMQDQRFPGHGQAPPVLREPAGGFEKAV